MSGYNWAAQTAVEPVSAADGGQWGNSALYSVISGCTLTYSAGDMTVDLAAGNVRFFGSMIGVAAAPGGFTLVSDPSNPRWTWLCVTSAGAPAVVSGSPAATPAVPSYGDRVPLALVLVPAGLTIASSATYKLNHSIIDPHGALAISTTAASTTSLVAVDLVTMSLGPTGAALSIPATQGFSIYFNFRKQALSANGVAFGLKINSTVVVEAAYAASTVPMARTTAANEAQNGLCKIYIPPRSSANYNSLIAQSMCATTATSAAIVTPYFCALSSVANPLPTATITSIAIRAINDTASNAAEITYVGVYPD